MAVSSSQTRIAVSSRTKQVQAKSRVHELKVVRSTAPEMIDSSEDPGDLTLLFENKLI